MVFEPTASVADVFEGSEPLTCSLAMSKKTQKHASQRLPCAGNLFYFPDVTGKREATKSRPPSTDHGAGETV